jgi:hypothetical protein
VNFSCRVNKSFAPAVLLLLGHEGSLGGSSILGQQQQHKCVRHHFLTQNVKTLGLWVLTLTYILLLIIHLFIHLTLRTQQCPPQVESFIHLGICSPQMEAFLSIYTCNIANIHYINMTRRLTTIAQKTFDTKTWSNHYFLYHLRFLYCT